MPVQAASFLYDTKAGAFKALANSTSTLVDLVMRYGEGEAHPGVRIVALRGSKGDIEINGTRQTLAAGSGPGWDRLCFERDFA